VVDQEYLQEFQRPPSKTDDHPRRRGDDNPQGFVVRNAPWHSAPDTASTEEFPSFGQVVQPRSGHAWGPGRKK
jgi:hypothetical protein